AQLRDQLQLFQSLELRERAVDQIEIENVPQDRPSRLRNARVVVIFILLNVAAFCVELWRGAMTNPVTLHRLGALDFFAVINKGEFWRLFTALFLHYNLLHLAFNLFALYVLGPSLEKIIGTVRFAACRSEERRVGKEC